LEEYEEMYKNSYIIDSLPKNLYSQMFIDDLNNHIKEKGLQKITQFLNKEHEQQFSRGFFEQ
jgi:DNA gyrase/topoisomerase IV subunit A